VSGSGARTVVIGLADSRHASAMATELLRRMGRIHTELVFRRRVVTGGGTRNGHVKLAAPGIDRRTYVTRIEKALLDGEIDITVRPLEDLPGELPPDLSLAAVLERADARDALCGSSLRALPRQGRVGAGGLRRLAQILALRPDLQPVRLRGPMTTQLQRLRRLPPLDAVVLPVAALTRLGLDGEISEPLAVDEFPPAPAQGALGVLARSADTELGDLLAAVHDPATAAAVEAERALQAGLHDGHGYPIGGHARIDGDRLRIIGQVTAPDGSQLARQHAAGRVDEAAALGRRLAADLLALGAGQILADIRPDDRL
jgi:hydroxymethylbilane synthase